MRRELAIGVCIGLGIALGVTTASAQEWGRPSVPSAGVCFYEDINFGGRYFCEPAGATRPEVPSGTNDQISSIRVFGRAEVTVFKDSRFRGSSKRFESDVRDLRKGGWNDRVSSFRVEARGGGWGGSGWGRPPTPSAGACFYRDVEFRGDYFCTHAGDSSSKLPSGTNNEISSIRLFGSATVTVYRDNDFRGASRRFDHSVDDLRTSGFNDLVSSYTVEPRGSGSGGWVTRPTREQAQQIVRRAYLSVLDREPDPASRGFVDHVMNDGWTEQRVETELRKSQEYRDKHKRD